MSDEFTPVSIPSYINVPLTDASRGITQADLDRLKAPFPNERLHVKIQSLSRDKTQAMLVVYLQHTDVQNRLDEVDPQWEFGLLEHQVLPGLIAIHAELRVKGVQRTNVGEGEDPKSAYSDALKRCAMLFGVGRFLYDEGRVWIPYNDSKDRYRVFTYEDYEKARDLHPREPAAPPTKPASTPELTSLTCDACHAKLVLSKKGDSYYCPNYKDETLGKHAFVRKEKTQGSVPTPRPMPPVQPSLSPDLSEEDVPF